MHILTKSPLILKFNLSNIFVNKMTEEIISYLNIFRRFIDSENYSNFTFIPEKNTHILINNTKHLLKKAFNKITFKKSEPKVYACIFDKSFQKTAWHNHISSSTITTVFYLKLTKQDNGINFKINNNQIFNYKPVLYDLLFFANYVDHMPEIPSDINDDFRVSINIDYLCEEKSQEILTMENYANRSI